MKIAVALVLACSSFLGCASFEKMYTDEQRRDIRIAEKVVIANREVIRPRLDSQDKRGVLVFVDVSKESLGLSSYGDTPLEAWMSYVKSLNPADTTKLPLPSEIARAGAFIYSAKYLGKNELLLSASFDGEVSLYYDLARSMSRLGNDIQDLRDITILLADSDKSQVENTKKLTKSFEDLSVRMGQVASQLQRLSTLQESTRSQLMQSLTGLERDLDRIESLIGAMR
jgi:hypothetical protein